MFATLSYYNEEKKTTYIVFWINIITQHVKLNEIEIFFRQLYLSRKECGIKHTSIRTVFSV